MCATRSWHNVVQHEGAACRPVAQGRGQPQNDPSPQLWPLLTPRSAGTSVSTEWLSGVSGLTWHLWHPAEFEVTHIGTEGEAVGPCEDGHPGTKFGMEDPSI